MGFVMRGYGEHTLNKENVLLCFEMCTHSIQVFEACSVFHYKEAIPTACSRRSSCSYGGWRYETVFDMFLCRYMQVVHLE